MAEEPTSYPDAITQFGVGDRPLRVECLATGLWKVTWRSEVVTLYRTDPRAELRVGYKPGRHRVRPDIAENAPSGRRVERSRADLPADPDKITDRRDRTAHP